MNNSAKRMICVLLALFLGVLPMLQSAPRGHAVEEELATTIEEQIRAYADSIDQANADDTAAWAIARHGITGNGRPMNVGESHALTAALMNSELVQVGLAHIFADTMETMQLLDMREVPSMRIVFGWYGQKSYYKSYFLTDSGEFPNNLDWMQTSIFHNGALNDYDNSLDWIAGQCGGAAQIRCIEDSGSQKTYSVTITLTDRFDFSTASSSGFKKFLSGIGMLLFEEFDWSSTLSFEVTVPYSYDHCSHSFGAYHWIYDKEARAMIPDGSHGYTPINVTHETFHNGEELQHYYELENTVRLYHDKPWVVEYDVVKPGKISFNPIETANAKTYPFIIQNTNQYLYVISKEYAMALGEHGLEDRYYAYHYLGTKLTPNYAANYPKLHTIRLENVISPDGSNMIHLTMILRESGAVYMDRVPMDDYSYYGGWMDTATLISENSTLQNGQDIYINYFGNTVNGLEAETLDLRIWENGIGAEGMSYYQPTAVVAPTCTSDGYTEYTCSACGHVKRDDVVPTAEHTWQGADCTNPRICTICGETHGEPLGHDYVNGTCTRCGITRDWVGKVSRLSGPNRYETGFAIANQLKANLGIEQFETVIVAYGQNFPDALTGSYLAAVKNAPIFLTEPSQDGEVLAYIRGNLVPGGKIYILGGSSAVSQAFEDGARNLGFEVTRLKGAGRYETNLAILEEAGVNTTDEILIATGGNYADSLSASATGLPMLLVDKTLTEEQKAFLENTSKNFVILGGTGAVSAEIEAELTAIGTVTRVKGASRYETSVEIARRYFENPQAAVLAYANGFPDGLCGGPLVLSMGAPLILTSNESYGIADDYIESITTGAVTGGTGRISDETVREIFDLSEDFPIAKP